MTRLRDLPWSAMDALVMRPRPSVGARTAIVVGAVASVVGIAAVDYATSVQLSFAVVYLVPVVIVTVLVGTRAGVLLAADSAVTWVLADSLITGRHDTLTYHLWNTAVRWLTLSFVVLLLANLRRSLARARASEQSSRDFLAFAAHQLRTPVATVQATTETLLLNDGGTASQERLLTNLANEIARIGRLVRSLLRVARLDQGEPHDPRPTDLVQICCDEAERVRHMSTHTVTVRVAADVPHLVNCERSAVAEALGNVLDNARRHADRRVEIRVDSLGHAVRIRVFDDGPGLPPGTEEQVFERFVTMDGDGGSGLGLAIARDLARRQGGDLLYTDHAFTLLVPSWTRHRIADPSSRSTAIERHEGAAAIEVLLDERSVAPLSPRPE